jgi:hypothetical protein
MTTETRTGKRRRRREQNAALYDDETLEFIRYIDAYRRRFDRSFPAWSEVLAIVKCMGYRKVEEAQPIEHCRKTEDAVEPVEPSDD